MLLGSFIFIALSREYITVLLCFRMPLESSSSSMPLSFPSPLPPVPDNISNSSPPPMSYITSQEMKCILHWLASWSGPQRGYFSTAPGKLQPLLESLEQTDHLVSLSASCVFGISGLEAGLSRNAMNFLGAGGQWARLHGRILPSSGFNSW